MQSVPGDKRPPAAGTDSRSWLARWRGSSPHPVTPPDRSEADPLSGFLAEEPESSAPPAGTSPHPPKTNGSRARWLMGGVAAAIVLSTVAAATLRTGLSPQPRTGTLSIDSKPEGVPVAIDGENRGRTPLTLGLPAGAHQLTLVRGDERHTVPLDVVAGRQSSQYFEFAPPAPAATTGRLSVTADAPGRVTLDGLPRGNTPLVLADIDPGEHLLSITSGTGTVDRKVVVQAGATTAAAFSFATAAGPVAGWVSVSAPFDVQVFDGTELVADGGANAVKLMLGAGRHDLTLVNDTLGYRETRRIDVAAGKVLALRVTPPMASLSANARPWADVTIDGVDVGQTPLANVPVAIGPHVVAFRHPQLGAQQMNITVTTKGPNRVSADLTEKK